MLQYYITESIRIILFYSFLLYYYFYYFVDLLKECIYVTLDMTFWQCVKNEGTNVRERLEKRIMDTRSFIVEGITIEMKDEQNGR